MYVRAVLIYGPFAAEMGKSGLPESLPVLKLSILPGMEKNRGTAWIPAFRSNQAKGCGRE